MAYNFNLLKLGI